MNQRGNLLYPNELLHFFINSNILEILKNAISLFWCYIAIDQIIISETSIEFPVDKFKFNSGRGIYM